MNLRLTTSALVLGATAAMLGACGAADGASEISVTDARVPVPAGPNGAAYMTLENGGTVDDRLIGARTDVAEAVELHETSTQDGSMAMRQLDAIDIPSGHEAVLEPGGLHVMLVDVNGALTEGDTVELTLTFESADEQTVAAEVVPTGDLPGMDMESSEGMDMESDG